MNIDKRRLLVFNDILSMGLVEVSELAKKYKCHINKIKLDIKSLKKRTNCVTMLTEKAKKKRNDKHMAVSLVALWSNEILVGKLKTNLQEKWKVAKRALDYTDDKDNIFLSGGATGFLLALEIARNEKWGISVLTNALYMKQFFSRIDRCRILEGRLAKHAAIIECSPEIDIIKKFEIKKAFLGVDALCWEKGAFCVKSNVTLQRSACFAASDLTIFLTDNCEFGTALPEEGRFVTFKKLKRMKQDYLVICNDKPDDPKEHARIMEEYNKFPEGRVILV